MRSWMGTSGQSTPIQEAHFIIGFIEEVTLADVCITTHIKVGHPLSNPPALLATHPMPLT
jgi:hypothetical protein